MCQGQVCPFAAAVGRLPGILPSEAKNRENILSQKERTAGGGSTAADTLRTITGGRSPTEAASGVVLRLCKGFASGVACAKPVRVLHALAGCETLCLTLCATRDKGARK